MVPGGAVVSALPIPTPSSVSTARAGTEPMDSTSAQLAITARVAPLRRGAPARRRGAWSMTRIEQRMLSLRIDLRPNPGLASHAQALGVRWMQRAAGDGGEGESDVEQRRAEAPGSRIGSRAHPRRRLGRRGRCLAPGACDPHRSRACGRGAGTAVAANGRRRDLSQSTCERKRCRRSDSGASKTWSG